MKKDLVTAEIIVKENKVGILRFGNVNYIFLTDLLHLVILNNLQNTNAELIKEKIPQGERLIRLNNSARRQLKVLKDNKNMKDLELLQKQVNKENNLKLL